MTAKRTDIKLQFWIKTGSVPKFVLRGSLISGFKSMLALIKLRASHTLEIGSVSGTYSAR